MPTTDSSVANNALSELLALRERMLDYDQASDRSGAVWDGLRIELDKRLLAIVGRVVTLLYAEDCTRAWRHTVALVVEHSHRLPEFGSRGEAIAEAASIIPVALVPRVESDDEPTAS